MTDDTYDAKNALKERLNELEREKGSAMSLPVMDTYFKEGWEVRDITDSYFTDGVKTTYTLYSTHGDNNFTYYASETTPPWKRKDGTIWMPDPSSIIQVDYSLPVMRLRMEPDHVFAAGFKPYEFIAGGYQHRYEHPLMRLTKLENKKEYWAKNRIKGTVDNGHIDYGRTLWHNGQRVFTSPSIRNPNYIKPTELYDPAVEEYQNEFVNRVARNWINRMFGTR